jgi:hypothetical protein
MFLLSILTGGGLIGGIVMLILRPALRSAAMGVARKVPAKVWLGLAGLLLIGALVWYHNHAVGKAYETGKQAERIVRDKYWQAEIASARDAAHNWKAAYDAKSTTVVLLRKRLYAEEISRNAALADDLRLRGPGKAGACPGRRIDPGLSGVPGGSIDPAPQPDAPGGPMPAGDGYAIVPWGWLVNKAEEYDRLLAEVKAVRGRDDDLRALHNEMIKRLGYPEPKLSANQ